MTKAQEVGLYDRSPALVKARKFVKKQWKHLGEKLSGDATIEIHALDFLACADLDIDVITASGRYPERGERLMRQYLGQVTKIAGKYPAVAEAMREYLPRLQGFAKRNSELQDLYSAYAQAFGGESR